ncbi:hypothetical protein [Aliarcobacter butzleri]|uniref:hypothetical protein n=1 Tax=Aliarcobacter butzleri TaxID=28197 RepID=UPI0021B3CA96|nr:hypothetical protein [Aliarcobacter butzleri]MCT7638472.1 hypothetical protein [Aliarcobacter butzleri]
MKTLIEKLENRKKITGKALQELFALILELEKNLDKDITTSDTSYKVNIKAEDYFCGSWLQSDDNFSLCILNGKITIKDIFARTKKDENGERYEVKESQYIDYFSIDDEDTNIVRINFAEFIKALEEVMNLAIEESQKIDNDAQKFIDFCLNWREIKEQK